MNSQERGDNITNEQQAAQLLQRIQFSGLVSTPFPRSLLAFNGRLSLTRLLYV